LQRACKERRRASSCGSEGLVGERHDNKFTSIDPGSREHKLEACCGEHSSIATFWRVGKDELDSVLAAGRLGFCRIAGKTREVLTANSQFKAEFGWPPDARLSWHELEKRVQHEDRAKLADAVDAAFTSGAEVDLIVRIQWSASGKQWVTIVAVRSMATTCRRRTSSLRRVT